MPPQFACRFRETTEITLGTHPYRKAESRLYRAFISAPIGAQVFAIERRNHSKTTVYGLDCVLRPVDTTTPVDKLKKAKKGLKFERFDVFFQLNRSSWSRWAYKKRIEREAATMGGHPFDSVRPFCGLNRAGLSSRSLRSISIRTEPSVISSFLVSPPVRALGVMPTRIQWSEAQRFAGKIPLSAEWASARPATQTHPPIPHGSPVDGGRHSPCSTNWAMGWDDRSHAQETAWRSNEETAQ
jgi:hypothetical protein